MPDACRVLRPGSIAEAVTAIAQGEAVPLAGATWVMRAALRGETLAGAYVALRGIPNLRELEVRENEVSIGAAITHAELAASLQRVPGCAGLAEAAQAANPAIRRVATVGGNLCSVAFAASDLAPALIAARAEVEIQDERGAARRPVEAFLAERAALPPGWLMTRVFAPRAVRLSAHARLPLRKAGDYPVAASRLSAWRTAAGDRRGSPSVRSSRSRGAGRR